MKIDDSNRVQIISTYETFNELLLIEEIETIIDNINNLMNMSDIYVEDSFMEYMINERKIKFVTS